jgi:tetratricopeptide (TPR) repeat protein
MSDKISLDRGNYIFTCIDCANNDFKKGLFTSAIEKLNKGLAIVPDSSELIGMLGNVYAGEGDWKQALYYYESAVKLDPKVQRRLLSIAMGTAFYNLGDFNSAITNLKYGLKFGLIFYPNESSGRWLLAKCYHETGHLQEAFREYKLVLKSCTGDMLLATHFMIADLYIKKKQFDDAIREVKKAIKVNPDNPDAHNWLAKCYMAKGLKDEAKSENQIAKSLGYDEEETY